MKNIELQDLFINTFKEIINNIQKHLHEMCNDIKILDKHEIKYCEFNATTKECIIESNTNYKIKINIRNQNDMFILANICMENTLLDYPLFDVIIINKENNNLEYNYLEVSDILFKLILFKLDNQNTLNKSNTYKEFPDELKNRLIHNQEENDLDLKRYISNCCNKGYTKSNIINVIELFDPTKEEMNFIKKELDIHFTTCN